MQDSRRGHLRVGHKLHTPKLLVATPDTLTTKKQKILNPSTFAYARYTFHPSGVDISKEKSICYQISSALLKSMEEHQLYLVPDSRT